MKLKIHITDVIKSINIADKHREDNQGNRLYQMIIKFSSNEKQMHLYLNYHDIKKFQKAVQKWSDNCDFPTLKKLGEYQ